eukprot:3941128-Rhodomonas_salina.7
MPIPGGMSQQQSGGKSTANGGMFWLVGHSSGRFVAAHACVFSLFVLTKRMACAFAPGCNACPILHFVLTLAIAYACPIPCSVLHLAISYPPCCTDSRFGLRTLSSVLYQLLLCPTLHAVLPLARAYQTSPPCFVLTRAMAYVGASVTVHALPSARLLAELKGHRSPVRALLWIPGQFAMYRSLHLGIHAFSLVYTPARCYRDRNGLVLPVLFPYKYRLKVPAQGVHLAFLGVACTGPIGLRTQPTDNTQY